MSCVICHISYVSCHLSHVTCHLSPITNANSHRPSPCLLPLYAHCTVLGWFIPQPQFSPSGEPCRSDTHRFCTGKDCLWDREEQHRGKTAQVICSSLLYGTRLPLGQRGATQRIDCVSRSAPPSLWYETAYGTGRSNTEDRLHS